MGVIDRWIVVIERGRWPRNRRREEGNDSTAKQKDEGELAAFSLAGRTRVSGLRTATRFPLQAAQPLRKYVPTFRLNNTVAIGGRSWAKKSPLVKISFFFFFFISSSHPVPSHPAYVEEGERASARLRRAMPYLSSKPEERTMPQSCRG